MSTKRNKQSAKRAAMLRKMLFHYMRDHHPDVVLKMRKKIDKIVPPVKKYASRPGNEVGL